MPERPRPPNNPPSGKGFFEKLEKYWLPEDRYRATLDEEVRYIETQLSYINMNNFYTKLNSLLLIQKIKKQFQDGAIPEIDPNIISKIFIFIPNTQPQPFEDNPFLSRIIGKDADDGGLFYVWAEFIDNQWYIFCSEIIKSPSNQNELPPDFIVS